MNSAASNARPRGRLPRWAWVLLSVPPALVVLWFLAHPLVIRPMVHRALESFVEGESRTEGLFLNPLTGKIGAREVSVHTGAHPGEGHFLRLRDIDVRLPLAAAVRGELSPRSIDVGELELVFLWPDEAAERTPTRSGQARESRERAGREDAEPGLALPEVRIGKLGVAFRDARHSLPTETRFDGTDLGLQIADGYRVLANDLYWSHVHGPADPEIAAGLRRLVVDFNPRFQMTGIEAAWVDLNVVEPRDLAMTRSVRFLSEFSDAAFGRDDDRKERRTLRMETFMEALASQRPRERTRDPEAEGFRLDLPGITLLGDGSAQVVALHSGPTADGGWRMTLDGDRLAGEVDVAPGGVSWRSEIRLNALPVSLFLHSFPEPQPGRLRIDSGTLDGTIRTRYADGTLRGEGQVRGDELVIVPDRRPSRERMRAPDPLAFLAAILDAVDHATAKNGDGLQWRFETQSDAPDTVVAFFAHFHALQRAVAPPDAESSPGEDPFSR